MQDAAYYSRREQQERALAEVSSDTTVRNVHILLAEKYAVLAQRELAKLSFSAHGRGQSIGVDSVSSKTHSRTLR